MIQPRQTLISATSVALFSALLGWLLVDVVFALGILLAGALVLADFVVLGGLTRRQASAAQTAPQGQGQVRAILAGLLSLPRLLAVLALLWLLAQRFSPVALLCGASSVVAGMSLLAFFTFFRDLRTPVQER